MATVLYSAKCNEAEYGRIWQNLAEEPADSAGSSARFCSAERASFYCLVFDFAFLFVLTHKLWKTLFSLNFQLWPNSSPNLCLMEPPTSGPGREHGAKEHT